MEKAPPRRGPALKKLLLALSVLFALVGFGILSIVVFNVRPYVNISGGQLGLLDYAHGIPVEATTNLKIADTSIKTYYRNGWSLTSLPRDRMDNWTSKVHKLPPPEKSDSIFAHYGLLSLNGEAIKHVAISGIEVDQAKFYLQTEKLAYKLYYAYPNILNFLVGSYCFWLLAQFVSAIQKGWSFTKKNRLRLQSIGWVLLILQAVYFSVEFMPPLINYFDVSYTATIPGYRSNFDFHADPVKPFSMMWLLIGALILVVAGAFRDGEMLQEDKDLIV
jgi:hypothetical protein